MRLGRAVVELYVDQHPGTPVGRPEEQIEANLGGIDGADRRVVSTWRADGRPDETSVGTVSGGVFTALQTSGTGYDSGTRRPNAQTLPGSRTVGVAINAMGELTSLTPPGRDAHTMTYDDDGRMETFTSPPPVSMGDPLELAWTYNARRQLTQHTRADGSHVDLDYDDTVTGHLETVTFPVVSYGNRPLVDDVRGHQSLVFAGLRYPSPT